MDKMMKELDQSGECIGIVVADIDRFKKINDTYNHAVGDKVIIDFADTLKSHLQEDDTLFRSGGEEFTLFLRKKSFGECRSIIEEVLHDIAEHSATAEYEDQQIEVRYSASFGLYYYKTDHNNSMQKGYVCADQLLLESKKLGRNRLCHKNELDD
ncbi:putative diguanylate cyclase YdaM [compost metagenome]